MTDLTELFVLPIGLKKIDSIDGIKLYTSDNLKEKYLQIIQTENSELEKEINSLVNKNVIIPCFMNRGLLRFIGYKLSGYSPNKYISAFIEKKKIYILIDNNVNILSKTNDLELTKTTVHECVHYVSQESPNSFLNIFNDELNSFYSELYFEMFRLSNKIDSLEIVKFIFNNFELEERRDLSQKFIELYRILQNTFREKSLLDSIEFEKILTEYISTARIFILSPEAFMKIYKTKINILRKIAISYKKAFGLKIVNVPGQELVYPSEPISVFLENNLKNTKIIQMFKKI